MDQARHQQVVLRLDQHFDDLVVPSCLNLSVSPNWTAFGAPVSPRSLLHRSANI